MYESKVLKEKRKLSRLLDLSSSPKQLCDLKPCDYMQCLTLSSFVTRKFGSSLSESRGWNHMGSQGCSLVIRSELLWPRSAGQGSGISLCLQREGRVEAIHLMPSQVLETGGSAGKLQEVCSGCIYWDTSDDSKHTMIGALVTSVRCLQSVTVSCALLFTAQV